MLAKFLIVCVCAQSVSVIESRRPIRYIGLAALTHHQYEPLFSEIPIYQSSALVRSFIADVNGHPRTLFALRDMLLHGEKFSDEFKPTRPALLANLRAYMRIQESDFQAPADVIVKALLQEEVYPGDLTEPGGLPYSYYIAMVCHVHLCKVLKNWLF